MDVFEKPRKTANPMPLSVKEWMCVLLILMPVTLGEEQIYLKITNFDPSQVELNCYSDFEGSMNNIFFDVDKAGYSCITRNSGWCNETRENNCNINCLSAELPEDLESLPFVVKLKGTCDEVLHVRCTIRNAVEEKLLDLKKSIQITAQSDPPIIFVNDGQPIEAGPERVQISCTVTNVCDKTELHVSAEVPTLHVNTTHTQTGNRFNTTSIFHAIFSDPGNYTILCKEMGKNNQFSRSSIVVVHPGEKIAVLEKDVYLMDKQISGGKELFNALSIGLLVPLILVVSAAVLGFLLYFFHFRKKSKGRKSDSEAEEAKKLLPKEEASFSDSKEEERSQLPDVPSQKERYEIIEKMIQQMTLLNIDTLTPRILSSEPEGEQTYPEDGPSIIHQVMKDLDREPNFKKLIKCLLPSNQMSPLSEKEDLSEIIWTKLEYCSIKDQNGAQECWRKLMNFFLDDSFSLDVTLSFRLLWRCALDYIILKEEQKNLTQYHKDIMKVLILHFDDKTYKKLINLHDSCRKIKAPFLQAILEGYMKTGTDDAGLLNFTIKSVPDFIFEKDHNLSIKEIIIEKCCEMVKTNACDHVDDEGRTPLHNLLEKLLTNNLWKRMSKPVDGTDRVWDLMSKLISSTNMSIHDKNGVSPYSWILWWKESLSYQDAPETLTDKLADISHPCHEEGAHVGLKTLREREMKEPLKKMIKLNIIADKETFKKEQRSVDRLKTLKGEICITDLDVTEDLKQFAQNHMYIWNDKDLEISQLVLEPLIVEVNAQSIYDIVLEKKDVIGDNREKVNYIALFDVLQLCLKKGACPTRDQIYEMSLLSVDVCTADEAQLAAVRIMESLIDAYRRKQVNNEPIQIYLNPIQDQWILSDKLRNVAVEVIKKAYPRLSDCLLSDSVINILLFLGRENNIESSNNIETCFQKANDLLQKDKAKPLAPKWAEEKVYEHFQAVEEKEVQQILVKRNDNWLKRSVLHLAAIFCQDEQVLKKIPKEIITKEMEGKDVNGYTPLYIARLHENSSAIKFLVSQGATSGENLRKELKSPSPEQYETCCFNIMENSPVFEPMKSMLILPVEEHAAVEKDLKDLFTRMLASQDVWRYEKIVIGGSVREKLKVCNWNDFNLQIYVKSKPYRQEPLASLKLHWLLAKRLPELDTTKSSLRCISVGDPWAFIWDGEGGSKGLQISVDVMFILIDTFGKTMNERTKLIIDEAPSHGRHRLLQRNDLMSEALWHDTFFLQEWDILDNLPPQCRLGILITMALIEAHDQTTPVTFMKSPITKNVLKNTLLWILAGRTPRIIEIAHGNVIREQYGALRQKLRFEKGDTRWMTEEDLKRYAKDGRFWAEKIFDAIAFMAREYKATLDSFLTSLSHELTAQEATIVQNICKRCLERLKPDDFFATEEYGSSEMEIDEGALRTRLQEVLDMLNGKVGTLQPGALLRKKKREAEELQAGTINSSISRRNSLHPNLKRKNSEITRLSHHRSPDQKEKQIACQLIEEDSEKFRKKLEQANQKESKLFKQYGGCDESQNSNSERNAEMCKLKKEIEDIHKRCEKLLETTPERSRLNCQMEGQIEETAEGMDTN